MKGKKIKKEEEDFKLKYLRALADYQNLERRVKEEKETVIKEASAQFILRLLPFLDNLERAEIFVKDEGLMMAKDQLMKILKEMGLEEINIVGQQFNPQLAEAVEVVEGDKDNIVIEVLRKGYRFNNKILRVAQVKVSKKKINEKETKEAKKELLKGDYM